MFRVVCTPMTFVVWEQKGKAAKFGFGEPQEPLGGTRGVVWGTAYRVLHHTVLYLESKNPKGKPGWGKIASHQWWYIGVLIKITSKSRV